MLAESVRGFYDMQKGLMLQKYTNISVGYTYVSYVPAELQASSKLIFISFHEELALWELGIRYCRKTLADSSEL